MLKPSELLTALEAHGLTYQGTMTNTENRQSIQGITEAGARCGITLHRLTADIWHATVEVYARPLYVECLGRDLSRWRLAYGWDIQRNPKAPMRHGSAAYALHHALDFASRNADAYV